MNYLNKLKQILFGATFLFLIFNSVALGAAAQPPLCTSNRLAVDKNEIPVGDRYCAPLNDVVKLWVSAKNLVKIDNYTYKIPKGEVNEFTINWEAPDAKSCTLRRKLPQSNEYVTEKEYIGMRDSNYPERTYIRGSMPYSYVKENVYRFDFSCTGYKDNDFDLDEDTITRAVRVMVGDFAIPKIDFKLSQPSIVMGEQNATLTWSVQNAQKVLLNQGIGPVNHSGTSSISPVRMPPSHEAGVTYILTAEAQVPELNEYAARKLTLDLPPNAQISYFTVNNSSPSATITKGEEQEATLRWDSVNTDPNRSLKLDPGNIDLVGSRGEYLLRPVPTETTIYTLSAYGKFRSTPVTKNVELKVVPPPNPEILKFDANGVKSLIVTRGQEVTINWATDSNAKSVSISPAIPNFDGTRTSGSIKFTPVTEGITRYTLTANGKFKLPTIDTEFLSIDVRPPPRPEITSFKANGSYPSVTITRGQKVTLSWTTDSNTRSVSISPPVQGFSGTPSGSVETPIFPKVGTYTYTLTATGAIEDVKSLPKSILVKVDQSPTPVISNFAAQPPLITRGQKTTLSWTTDSNTKSVSVSPEISNFDSTRTTGSIDTPVFPREGTYTFTLTATGAFPDVQSTLPAYVNVGLPPKPKVLSFSVDGNKTTIAKGEKIILRWSSDSNAQSVVISPISGTQNPSGYKEERPLVNTTYTIKAYGATQDIESNPRSPLTINVGPPIDPVLTVSSDKESINPGDSVTFQWTGDSNTKSVSVSPSIPGFSGTPSGSVTSTFTKRGVFTYTFTPHGEFSDGRSKSVLVAVDFPPPPQIYFFGVTPDTVDIGKPAKLSWRVEERAASMFIDPDIGEITVKSGSTDVFPKTKTAYILTVRDKFTGSVPRTSNPVVVGVNIPKPSIKVTVDSELVTSGDSVTFRWTGDSNTKSVSVSPSIPGFSGTPSGSIKTPALARTTTFNFTPHGEYVDGDVRSVTIIVNPPPTPKIIDFGAKPSPITRGQKTTLSWITDSNTKSVSISPSIEGFSGEPNGSVETPVFDREGTYPYNLTAIGSSTDIRSSPRPAYVIVNSPPKPEVLTFEAKPPVVTRGEKTILSWTSDSNTKSVSISPSISGFSGKPNGSVETPPLDKETTYDLIAIGAFPDVKSVYPSQITIGVGAPPRPRIVAFETDPKSIFRGGSAKLIWKGDENTASVFIEPGVGVKGPSGQVEISPDRTTTYTITPGDKFKESGFAESVVLTVNPPQPQITYFKVEPESIIEGEKATLSWSSENANSLLIDQGIGIVSSQGSFKVSPTSATKYTISVVGKFPETEFTKKTVELGVTLPGAPRITNFTIKPESVNLGEKATLSWSSENATKLSIDQGIGGVDVVGSTVVSPRGTTVYTITGEGDFKKLGKAQKSVTLKINVPTGPHISSFTLEPSVIKRGESSALSWSSENATVVFIEPGIGPVKTSGSIKVSPTITTRYTITAQGKFKESGEDKKFILLKVGEILPSTSIRLPEIPEEEEEKPAEIPKPTAKPTIDLKVNGQDGPLTIAAPATFALSWNLDAYCLAHGSWIDVKNKAGQDRRTESRPGTYTYKLYCPTTGSDEVIVKVVSSGGVGGDGIGGGTSGLFTDKCESNLPCAEASISLDRKNFEKRISVIRGEPVQIWLGAAYDINGDNLASRDETNGWTKLMSSGGRCDWNTDLNQGDPIFEITGTNPENPEQCTYYLGELNFNDEPGIYNYGVLRLVQSNGKISNIAPVEIEVKEPPLPPGPPEIDLRIDNLESPVVLGAPADYNVSWNVKNADSCVASGSWGGDKFISGSQRFVSSEKNDFVYTLACTGKLGTTSESISLKVAELPVCDFSALPTVVSKSSFERQSVLSWKCQFANTCSISPSVDIEGKTFGSTRVSPTETTNYTLTCQNLDGSSSFDAAVEVR